MPQADSQNRRIHADRCASAVNRDLSSAIGVLAEMGCIMDSEFHTIALEIDKLKRRIEDIAGRVQ